MHSWQPMVLLILALAGLSSTADAQWAYTAKEVNLRAGPQRDYPVVARLPGGVSISVAGCLRDYRWCDVLAGPHRGWVYAQNIVYPYQGTNVPVLTYGTLIGLGVVTFSVARYWDTHYVGRPWYRQRHAWVNRPPPGYRPAARPPHRPPDYRPGRPLPPPHYRPSGGHRPPPAQGPGTGHRPPHGQGPGGGHRPPPNQGPGADHRPPPGQGPGADHRPPPGQGPGTGHRPPSGYGPGSVHRPPGQ
jgi:uncharacterized protein YraI